MSFLLPLNAMMGASSLIQGGGFGFGYGFGVRAGYDTYGAVKDQLLKAIAPKATQMRYASNGGFLDNMGSGLLSGLRLN